VTATVRAVTAMTCEIMLRGMVRRIVCLEEKALAAHRGGVDTLIVPKANQPDLEDLPPKVRRAIHFILVEGMDEVLSTALRPRPTAH
jgi:ATP-dependent Lon protease